MPATPRRRGRQPREGSKFLSEVVGSNVRAVRAYTSLSQDGLAERMRSLGHNWSRATVSEIERAGRTVTVDELLGLALALNAKPGELLVAKGSSIDLGGQANAVPALFVERWLAGFMRVAVDPSDPTSLLVKPDRQLMAPANDKPQPRSSTIKELKELFEETANEIRYVEEADEH